MRDLASIVKANAKAEAEERKNAALIRVMIRLMRNELDYHGIEELREYHEELNDVSEEELRAFLDAGETFEG